MTRLQSLKKIVGFGMQMVQRGKGAARTAAKSPLFNFHGAAGMRKVMFGGIGAGAAAMALTSCSEDDFLHDHKLDHNADVNFKLIDIPTKTEYITKTDTVYQDKLVRDTLYLPGEIVRDTVFLPGETVRDTVYLPGEVVRDTVFQDRIVHDTTYVDRPVYIEVPGESVILPDTLRPEPDPYIDDFTHNVLGQDNDTTGVTVRVQGNKDYEQIFGSSTLVPAESNNKKMVFKTFNNFYEKPENPSKYFTKTEVTVGTLEDGRKGLYVSKIPAYAGFNFGSYDGAEQNWNRALAQNELIVKSYNGKQLERYVRGANGKFVFAGTISPKEQRILQDKHVLPEGNQTWEQKITNFETQSAYVTKEHGKDWTY